MGDQTGRIALLDAKTLEPLNIQHKHLGSIAAIVCRQSDGLIAALSVDRHVSLWKVVGNELRNLSIYSVRDIRPKSSDVAPTKVRSESQALSLHPELPYLCSRTGGGDLAIFEIGDDAQLKLLDCVVVHPLYDIVTCRFTGDGLDILTGTIRGNIALVRDGKIHFEWKMEDESIHWFEPVGKKTWLLASDSRRVGRLVLDGNLSDESFTLGPVFAKDDFEHIHHSISNKIYGSSFDRNIYELDSVSLRPLRTVATLPFKLRWMTSFVESASDPSKFVLLVQCRNGAVYRVSEQTGEVLGQFKNTPDTFWSGIVDDSRSISLFGESSYPTKVSIDDNQKINVTRTEASVPRTSPIKPYTKRAVAIKSKPNHYLIGEIDGSIFRSQESHVSLLKQAEGGVRDLAINKNETEFYFGTELGKVERVELGSGQTLASWSSDKPLRSIALNESRELLVVSERLGDLVFLDMLSLKEVFRCSDNRAAKRMQWLEEDVLYYNSTSKLHKFDLKSRTSSMLTKGIGNTIEDFCVDHEGRYVLTVNYMRDVTLADYKTGEILDRILDDYDYSKGILWLGDTDFAKRWGPGCFATFGRTGRLNVFAIYEEKIMPLERISCATST